MPRRRRRRWWRSNNREKSATANKTGKDEFTTNKRVQEDAVLNSSVRYVYVLYWPYGAVSIARANFHSMLLIDRFVGLCVCVWVRAQTPQPKQLARTSDAMSRRQIRLQLAIRIFIYIYIWNVWLNTFSVWPNEQIGNESRSEYERWMAEISTYL